MRVVQDQRAQQGKFDSTKNQTHVAKSSYFGSGEFMHQDEKNQPRLKLPIFEIHFCWEQTSTAGEAE